MVKIGYLILCNDDPELIALTTGKLLENNNDVAIIHVDSKVSDQPFRTRIQENRAFFVNERFPIYWGGFNSIKATVKLMEYALRLNCDRCVILQGKDFPIVNQNKIHDFFDDHPYTEFAKAFNVTKSKKPTTYMKAYGFHIFDYDSFKHVKKGFNKILSAINRLGIKYCSGQVMLNEGVKRDVYWGWAHISLTKECMRYVVEFYENNPSVNHRFCNIFPADETYFQTLIYNSRFRYSVVDGNAVDEATHSDVTSMLNLTYFEYPDQVRIFNDLSELDEINLTGFLFIRKVTRNFAKQAMLL